MFSIENFYWILFQNLLKPLDFDCWYYHPFGTKNILCRSNEFKLEQAKQEHHVLFYFDQEPIWTDDFGMPYNSHPAVWSKKLVKIMANSEHSQIKKTICQQRDMLDWYFFYHGFAALDWFRDGQYIVEHTDFDQVFVSFNHQIRDRRCYRMALTARLLEKNLEKFGLISFHGDQTDCQEECDSPYSLLSRRDKDLVINHMIKSPGIASLLSDKASVNSEFSAHYGVHEHKLWQKCFVHVVNETVFYDEKLHLTEKIFKPIVCSRPFILVSAPGNLKYLKSYGFKTFDTWIDESYDQIIDPSLRLDMIASVDRKSVV
jgi:hypothetical protein